MNPKWRRFAPFGLLLSLVAALVSLGLYIVFREVNIYLQISLVLIVVGIVAWILLDPQQARQAVTGRQAKHGSNALVLIIAFVGILLVINFLVYKNDKRWDLTEDKQYTLSQETIQTLASMPQPVKALAFYSKRVPTDSAKGLLDQFQYNGGGKFSYEFIDPEANPVAAEKAKITRDGTIVLVMGDRQELADVTNEEELTGAMVRLINPQKRVVYFLTGHGEHDTEGTGDTAYSMARRTLESKNYTVKKLNLLAENKIPEDARVLVVASPIKQLSQTEVDLIGAYVTSGKGLIVMEEPLPVTEFGDQPDPLADYLEKNWGITLGKDMVVDLTSRQPLAPIGAEYGSHAITQKMQGLATIFPTARSTTLKEQTKDVSQVEIVKTAPQSWAETDLQAFATAQGQNPALQFDPGKDIQGPITLGVAAENFTNKGRVVTLGDGDYASDAYYTIYGNGDLLINSVDWAAGNESLISLTPKRNTQRMVVPPQSVVMNLLLLGTIFLLPGLMLVAGVVTFIQRRRRG